MQWLRARAALIGIRILVRLRDWRRVPFPCKYLTLRSIKAHGQVERFFWRRKPICFLVCAWNSVLEIKVERIRLRWVLQRRTCRSVPPPATSFPSFRIVFGRVGTRRESFQSLFAPRTRIGLCAGFGSPGSTTSGSVIGGSGISPGFSIGGDAGSGTGISGCGGSGGISTGGMPGSGAGGRGTWSAWSASNFSKTNILCVPLTVSFEDDDEANARWPTGFREQPIEEPTTTSPAPENPPKPVNKTSSWVSKFDAD